MTASIVGQIRFLVDFVPAWLGPTLLTVGVVLLLTGVYSTSELYRDLSVGNLIGLFVIGLGATLMVTPLYVRSVELTIAFIAVLGHAVEGVATVRTYQRYVYSIKNLELTGSLTSRIMFGVVGVVLAVTLLSVGVVYLLVREPSLSYSLAMIRTLVVVGLSVGAVGYSVDRVRSAYSLFFYVGFILTVVGAEIHNLRLAADLAVWVVGQIAFILGGGLALYTWDRLLHGEYQRLTDVFALDYYTKQYLRQ